MLFSFNCMGGVFFLVLCLWGVWGIFLFVWLIVFLRTGVVTLVGVVLEFVLAHMTNEAAQPPVNHDCQGQPKGPSFQTAQFVSCEGNSLKWPI